MLLSPKKLDTMPVEERLEYFRNLRDICTGIKYKKRGNAVYRKLVTTLAPNIRNYDFEIVGEENIPLNGKAIFACNHSNAHDFFTLQEAFKRAGVPITFLASNEDLSPIILNIFEGCGAILMDRSDKNSAEKALLDFASSIHWGGSGVIFPESTWNMHPTRPMQPVKAGLTMVATITKVPIIPTIFEYVESSRTCTKESELYTKVVVRFGAPIYISMDDKLISQTDEVQRAMESTRRAGWKNLKIARESLDDVNPYVYTNHTYLKKFGSAGAEFDSNREMKYLLEKEGVPVENEYTLTEDGLFVPGIIKKEDEKRFVKRM